MVSLLNVKKDLQKKSYKVTPNVNHELFIKKYEASIGWSPRWRDLDILTQKMNCYSYMNYVECRETSLLLKKKNQIKFMKWIGYKINNISKFCIRFLNFLIWDRIGLIIQTAKIRRIYLNLSKFSEEPLKTMETIKSIIDLCDIYPVPCSINRKMFFKRILRKKMCLDLRSYTRTKR